jgi:hypothetical protein
VPGLRLTVSVLAPPWKVGVAPMVGPLVPCWIVRLCASAALLVNWIVTLPGFAVREVFVNLSWPLESAATVKAPDAGAEVDGVLDAGAEVDVAGVLGVDVLLLLDPPHALRLSTRIAVAIATLVVFGIACLAPLDASVFPKPKVTVLRRPHAWQLHDFAVASRREPWWPDPSGSGTTRTLVTPVLPLRSLGSGGTSILGAP